MDVVPGVPNIAVPAWEFPDIPAIDLENDPQQNWARVAEQVDLIITHTQFSRAAFLRAGVRTPVHVVPVPIRPDYFAGAGLAAGPARRPRLSVLRLPAARHAARPPRPWVSTETGHLPARPSLRQLYKKCVKAMPERFGKAMHRSARAVRAAVWSARQVLQETDIRRLYPPRPRPGTVRRRLHRHPQSVRRPQELAGFAVGLPAGPPGSRRRHAGRQAGRVGGVGGGGAGGDFRLLSQHRPEPSLPPGLRDGVSFRGATRGADAGQHLLPEHVTGGGVVSAAAKLHGRGPAGAGPAAYRHGRLPRRTVRLHAGVAPGAGRLAAGDRRRLSHHLAPPGLAIAARSTAGQLRDRPVTASHAIRSWRSRSRERMRQLVSADSVWPRLAAALDEGAAIHRRTDMRSRPCVKAV